MNPFHALMSLLGLLLLLASTTSAQQVFTGPTTLTLDAEATGTSLTIPTQTWVPAALCQAGVAAPNWDTFASAAPSALCVNSGSTVKGVLEFDGTSDECVQLTLMLPTDWTGAIDVTYKWLTTATTGSVAWCSQLVCVADAETDDNPTFPAQATGNCVTDAAKTTTLQTNDVTDTAVTATGCAAGELLHWRLCRDPDATATLTDDISADARLIGALLTLRRAM